MTHRWQSTPPSPYHPGFPRTIYLRRRLTGTRRRLVRRGGNWYLLGPAHPVPVNRDWLREQLKLLPAGGAYRLADESCSLASLPWHRTAMLFQFELPEPIGSPAAPSVSAAGVVNAAITSLSAADPGDWLASLPSAERKEFAVERGLLAYFPDALAAVARHSVRSNAKHNPGEPVHWTRGKSNDHGDCLARHHLAVSVDRNSLDDGQPHIICRAWRALADLQVWIEEQHGLGKKI